LPFFKYTLICFVGIKYLLPIFFSHILIISSILIFSIPLIVFKHSLIVYSIILLFITNSCLLNSFKFSTIFSSCFSDISSYMFFVILLRYSSSSVATSANLFNVLIMFWLNSFFIYGIISFLTLFLLYMFSLFDSSYFGSNLFFLQYSSISSLSISISGLIYFSSLLASMPFRPDIPLPLSIFNITVSALSLELWAVAILF